MNRTLKTAGVSLALLTACLSANTVFADSVDALNPECIISKDNTVSIKWDQQNKDQVSSYKIYVSDPLSQADCYSPDLKYNYLEDSAKLSSDSKDYYLRDLKKGYYYSFKLEAYKDDKLVRSDSLVSLIPGEKYSSEQAKDIFFNASLDTRNNLTISWDNIYKDYGGRIMKFYSIDDKGLTEIGTADLASGSYTMENLDAGKKYYIAGEVLSGAEPEFIYQFGFTTDYSKPGKFPKNKMDDLYFYPDEKDPATYNVKIEDNLHDFEIPDDADYKFYISEPLSSKDYYARKEFSYNRYLNIDYYIPCNEETGFDQFGICSRIKSGKTDVSYETKPSEFKCYGLKPDMYYSVRLDAYKDDVLIASGTTIHAGSDYSDLFWYGDVESDEIIRAKSKDGKTVNITWEDLSYLLDDKLKDEKTIVYLYLSEPYKDRKKAYVEEDPEVRAKYFGKTDYKKCSFKLKGLTPGRHYVLYLEARINGMIMDHYYFPFSTTVRMFKPDHELTGNGSLELNSYINDFSHVNRLFSWYTNGCIFPEGVDYYRKDKSGKFKKIGTTKPGETINDKNISTGKTYEYKARSYAVINGKKVYSGFTHTNKIKIENYDPKLKVSFIDKKNNIVKITSDKNNGILVLNNSYYNQFLRYGYNGKTFKNKGLEIEPGKTVYVKLLKKKKLDDIDMLYNMSASSEWNNLACGFSLDIKKSTYKITRYS